MVPEPRPSLCFPEPAYRFMKRLSPRTTEPAASGSSSWRRPPALPAHRPCSSPLVLSSCLSLWALLPISSFFLFRWSFHSLSRSRSYISLCVLAVRAGRSHFLLLPAALVSTSTSPTTYPTACPSRSRAGHPALSLESPAIDLLCSRLMISPEEHSLLKRSELPLSSLIFGWNLTAQTALYSLSWS